MASQWLDKLLYGKAFYKKEFGVDVDNLWLPDVFGYSAALPQILKLSEIDYFLTQKYLGINSTNFHFKHLIGEELMGQKYLLIFLQKTHIIVNLTLSLSCLLKKHLRKKIS